MAISRIHKGNYQRYEKAHGEFLEEPLNNGGNAFIRGSICEGLEGNLLGHYGNRGKRTSASSAKAHLL